MKKIINKPESVVIEMCQGIVAAHPELMLIPKFKIIRKKLLNDKKVTLISGGGSGHEPAHAGFVGMGMLDAAVCGDVFASPSQIQVYKAIKETASAAGALLIIKNYSGDVMNFKNAAYLAGEDGIAVEYILVDDDIAVTDSLYTVGRRGVAGTVLVHKIAGAAAEEGLKLEEVKRIAQKTAAQVKSIGFALSSCTVPAKGTPTFELSGEEMEYGVGIHGEPGIQREEVVCADALAERMTASLLKELQIEKGSGQEVAVLVNGFGATPLQELYLLNFSVMKELTKAGVRAVRVNVGNFMTSIDMEGASLSILKLDDELKAYLKRPCRAPGFQVSGLEEDNQFSYVPEEPAEVSAGSAFEMSEQDAAIGDDKITLDNMKYLIHKMSEIIIANEVPFCELDSHAGDGDFGMSIAKGFRELKQEWAHITSGEISSIGRFLEECSFIIMEFCGGASGPIWGSAFRSAGKYAGKKEVLSAIEFAELMQAAVKGIQETGARSFGRGAEVGDKTLIDALVPCADMWTEEAAKGTPVPEIFEKAAQAAVDGANFTKGIVARMGRAGTVGKRSLGYPDAGAYGLGVIFTELSDSMR